MANIGGAVSTLGRGTGGLFSKLFRIKFAYYFIIILFIQAIATGISSGNGTLGIIQALGERFFNVTQGLQATSLQVIENGAIFNGYWSFIVILWSLFSSIYLIYLWIKLFMKLYGNSPLSNQSEGFRNFAFAIITFILLQIGYLLFMKYQLNAEFLSSYDFKDIFALPVFAFIDLFKAIILIFSSIGFKKAVESSVNSSLNVCTNPAGCVI